MLRGAHAAAVDLAGAQSDELRGLGGEAVRWFDLPSACSASIAPGAVKAGWFIRACIAIVSIVGISFAGHIGARWRVNAMTRPDGEM